MRDADEFLIDFREIDSGEDFECLVQELFQELGYQCRGTGRGPDHRVDLVLEKTIEDLVGGPLLRRYVVQCKHQAVSGKAVSLESIGGGVVECVEAFAADGYLLVTSSLVTSSLQEEFDRLSRVRKQEFRHWDRTTLAAQIRQFPNLAIRYFPSALVRYRPRRPASKRGSQCYERILAHQRTFVGIKFIPELYVTREIEGDLLCSLLPDLEALERAPATAQKELTSFRQEALSFRPPSAFIRSHQAPASEVYEWIFDFSQSHRDRLVALRPLKEVKIDYLAAYLEGGLHGLLKHQDALRNFLGRLQANVLLSLAPVIGTTEVVVAQEQEISRARESYNNMKMFKSTLTRAESDSLRRGPPRWKRSRITGSKVVRFTKDFDADQISPATEVWEGLQEYRQRVNRNYLSVIDDELRPFTQAVQVIVDLAGSGKTNLACRLALQLSHRAFAVFLTGRSHQKEFTAIDDYLNSLIAMSYPDRSSYTLAENSRWLFKKRFPLVVILDGVNEAPSVESITTELVKLMKLASSCPIRVLITSRTEYWSLFEGVFRAQPWTTVIEGKLSRFGEREYDKVREIYFRHYQLRVRVEGRAWQQLRHPLLMRFFCEAFGSPAAPSVRVLPTISEVNLTALFAEYCKLKYKNIDERLSAGRVNVVSEGVEGILLNFANSLLLSQRSSMPLAEARTQTLFSSEAGRLAYRALLDEDVILEEFPDPVRQSDRVLRVGFVYEAFMEFLMARVLLRNCKRRDLMLFRAIGTLLKESSRFQNIRGIMTFLAPETAEEFPRSFGLICETLKDPAARDLCLPTLVNMWNSSWEEGILPILEAIDCHWPSIAVEDVRNFLMEWIPSHGGKSFLLAVAERPLFALRLLGEELPEVVGKISEYDYISPEDVLAATLATLNVSRNVVVSSLLIGKVIRKNLSSRGDYRLPERSLRAIISTCTPLLGEIGLLRRWERDWSILWDLARVAELSGIRIRDIAWSEEERVQLAEIIETAILDYYYRRSRGSDNEVSWWINLMKWKEDELRKKVQKEMHSEWLEVSPWLGESPDLDAE